MHEDETFWDFYWDVRLQEIETLGKRAALVAASKLVRRINAQRGQPARLLELGCGDGQILGPLIEAHARDIGRAAGVDYKRSLVEAARARYPGAEFVEGDFTDEALLRSLGSFDLLLLVNALHEVFSAAFSEALGEVDTAEGKAQVREAFARAVGQVSPGGYVLLFDGLEPALDPRERVVLRFLTPESRRHFETFAAEYRPFRIRFDALDAARVELAVRDFTRYITKSIFLGKGLWQSERFESYQYFNEQEFRAMVAQAGLTIERLETLTVNEDKWQRAVAIETPGVDFPVEHILMILRK